MRLGSGGCGGEGVDEVVKTVRKMRVVMSLCWL